jgi:cyclopropane fatty-acyl-phospholipid synthase-like methyltransferase
VRARERLLNTLTWSGDERVLGVGCGRSLMLLGAAKRLRGGRAVGVDLWRTEDLAGNTASALR